MIDYAALERAAGRSKTKQTRRAANQVKQRQAEDKSSVFGLPQALLERFEAQSRLWKVYRDQYQHRLNRAMETEPALGRLVAALKREEKVTCLMEMGVVDLDLESAISCCGLSASSQEIRFLALAEVSRFLMRVTERETGEPFNDPIPWLQDQPTTLQACKKALRIA